MPQSTTKLRDSSTDRRALLRDLIHEDPAQAAERARAKRCEASLYSFLRRVWPIIEPGVRFLPNWHLEYLAEHLETVTVGDQRRLAFCMPPRYMKSSLGTIAWPVWEWCRRPSQQFLATSYAETLSSFHARKRMDILGSEWYQTNWPRARIAKDAGKTTFYENVSGGHMIASSVMGYATGLGGNRVIIDDPMNPKQAVSDAERAAINRTVKNTLISRLNDKKKGAIVLYMQRLHIDDTLAYLTGITDRDLEPGKVVIKKNGWTVIRLPIVAEVDTEIVFPRSGRRHFWKAGAPLWHLRETLDQILALRAQVTEEDYAAQWMQRAQKPGGNIIKHEWLDKIYYQTPNRLYPIDGIIQSWDASFKDLASSSYVVGQTWARKGVENYLLDQVRGRWDFPTTLKMVRAARGKWPDVTAVLIEDAANGPAIISTLKAEIAGIKPVTPEGSKVARLKAVSLLYENGHVWLPDPLVTPWVADYILELTTYNGSESSTQFSDQVDASSQALSFLERTYGTRSLQTDEPRKFLMASRGGR